jgi:hypothetical protein
MRRFTTLLMMVLLLSVGLFSADYLIVLAKADFTDEIQGFVQFKQAQGRSVRVEVLEGYPYLEGSDLETVVGDITVDGETFTNVEKGNQNYVVLKHYIKKWYQEEGSPSTFYVLLVGSAKLLSPYFNGYRDDLLYDVTWRIWRDHEYWNLDDDDPLEAMVGRWPVYYEQDVTTIADKTIRYANSYGTWTQDIRVFGTFENDAMPLAQYFRDHTPYSVSELYGGSDAYNGVTQQFFTEGHSLFLYRGHGGPYIWQGGDYASKDLYENGLNYSGFDKHGVMLSISCDTGFLYDITQHPFAGSPDVWGMVNGEYRNIGEQYILQPNGGAAFFGASVYMSSGTDQDLAWQLVHDISDNGVRDIGTLALNAVGITPKYNLLGDPDLDIVFRLEPVQPVGVDLAPQSMVLAPDKLSVVVRNNGIDSIDAELATTVLRKTGGSGSGVLLETSFETGNPFTFGGSNSSWAVGAPDYKVTAAYDGSYTLATNPTYKYNRDEDSYAQVSVNLSGTAPAFLEFWQAYDFNGGYSSDLGEDIGIIEISTDGAQWQVLTPQGGYPDVSNDNPVLSNGTPCFAAQNLTWHKVDIDLSGYSGTVTIRFRVISDSSWVYAGWYIDDVKVYEQGVSEWETYFQVNTPFSVGGETETTVDITNTFLDGEYKITAETQCKTDMVSGNNQLTNEISLGNIAPTAYFTFETNGLEVAFTDASADSDGVIAAWNWDFGDGNVSSAQSPLHQFTVDGDYSVVLTVIDDFGATATYTSTVTVSNVVTPDSYTNDTDYSIPDGSSSGVLSPVTVTRTGDSGSVSVTVSIVHNYVGDLTVSLIAPNGTQWVLRQREGGSADNINETYTVDASGIDSTGVWNLKVQDTLSLFSGYIDSWTLQFPL